MGKIAACRLLYKIGPRYFSLYNLYEVPFSDFSAYLVNEEFKVTLKRVNAKEDRVIVDDKMLFYRHCLANDLSTIDTRCFAEIQSHNSKDNDVYCTPNNWIANEPTFADRIFVKLIDGSWGVDAFSAERVSGRWRFCGQEGSAEEFLKFLTGRLAGRKAWIIQPFIRPHMELERVMSKNALGTVRIVSAILNGMPRIVGAVLRIPVGENYVDNFSHGASGNLIAAVDLNSGCLEYVKGSKESSWPVMSSVSHHPDTKQAFDGFVLPMWKQAVQCVIDAHKTLPKLRTLGWDIAITDSGPLIVEANATYDVDILQAAYGRGFKKEMMTLLS